jgi:hypothetical protein
MPLIHKEIQIALPQLITGQFLCLHFVFHGNYRLRITSTCQTKQKLSGEQLSSTANATNV